MAKTTGRFAGVDWATREPEPWQFPNQVSLGAGFRCRRGEFTTYWKQGRVQRECEAGIARAFVLRNDEGLAAYITLLADKLEAEVPLLQGKHIHYRTFPALKIGLLAADARARGAGRALVQWAIGYAAYELAPKLGLRFVTVDALYDPDTGYDAAPVYQELGFFLLSPNAPLPTAQPYRTMFFDLRALTHPATEHVRPASS